MHCVDRRAVAGLVRRKDVWSPRSSSWPARSNEAQTREHTGLDRSGYPSCPHTCLTFPHTFIRPSPTHPSIYSIDLFELARRISYRQQAFILRPRDSIPSPRKKTRKVPGTGPGPRPRTWTCTAPPSPAHLVVVPHTIPHHTTSQPISIPSVCSIAGRNQSDRLLVCARARLPGTRHLHHPSWLPARASRKPTFSYPTTPTHTRLNPTTAAHHVAPGDPSGHHLLPGLRTIAPEHHLHAYHQGHPVGQLPGL